MLRYHSKKKQQSVDVQFNESLFGLLIYGVDHYSCQVIIRRRTSRVFMFSSISVSSIFLSIEEIIIGVK